MLDAKGFRNIVSGRILDSDELVVMGNY